MQSGTSRGFDPKESIGIFIGVSRFPDDDQILEVPYAVDDAVDLAYLFSMELHLVAPSKVHLLLSGEERKWRTEKKRRRLRRAGAHVMTARNTDIFKALDQHVHEAGTNGLLIISLATHGYYSTEGVQYFLLQDSLLGRVEDTGFPEKALLASVEASPALRRIILLDSCRRQMSRNRGGTDVRTTAPGRLGRAIASIQGTVVISAASPGGFAYDDSELRNGVFTRAIIDGLQCESTREAVITISSLIAYVDRRVRRWVEDRYETEFDRPVGIHVAGDKSVESLPLVLCRERPLPSESQSFQNAVEQAKSILEAVFGMSGAFRQTKLVKEIKVLQDLGGEWRVHFDELGPYSSSGLKGELHGYVKWILVHDGVTFSVLEGGVGGREVYAQLKIMNSIFFGDESSFSFRVERQREGHLSCEVFELNKVSKVEVVGIYRVYSSCDIGGQAFPLSEGTIRLVRGDAGKVD